MLAYIHRETVVANKYIIVTYRIEGSHPTFGDEYYAVYSDKSPLGEFKFKDWANKFHEIVVEHTKHNIKAVSSSD